MTHRVELIGGKFDGLVCDIPDAGFERGFAIVLDCPHHGIGGACECEDIVFYGYLNPPGASGLTFRAARGGESNDG